MCEKEEQMVRLLRSQGDALLTYDDAVD